MASRPAPRQPRVIVADDEPDLHTLSKPFTRAELEGCVRALAGGRG
jgi:hypothetical protein